MAIPSSFLRTEKQLTLKKMALELTAGAEPSKCREEAESNQSNNTVASHKDSMLHRKGLQQVPSEDESHPGLFHQ